MIEFFNIMRNISEWVIYVSVAIAVILVLLLLCVFILMLLIIYLSFCIYLARKMFSIMGDTINNLIEKREWRWPWQL